MPKPTPITSSLKRVYILHLLPLEYYPPITNLLNILSKDKQVKTAVFQTNLRLSRASLWNFDTQAAGFQQPLMVPPGSRLFILCDLVITRRQFLVI